MPITTQPNQTFEAVADGYDTGLTGTIGVRITDGAGATTTARVTAGITEYPAGSGIYQATLTAPGTSGQYVLVWDDGTTFATDDLLVTATALSAATGSLYVTSSELKAALGITATDYADAQVEIAVNAASRGIDQAVDQFFYPNAGTRYYTPEAYASSIEIAPLTTLTTVEVDLSGAGTYTTWTSQTDFWLEPVNNPEDGKPYERLSLRSQLQRSWPPYQHSVKVTGTFGWAEVPSEVRQFAMFFAEKLLYRTRHAPFGILTISGDIGAVARLARTDPDFAPLLGHLVRTRPFI